jgi:hypothetical protein
VGTHGTFRRALLERLAREPALRSLATRDLSDPSVALLDAWALVLDVLAFYQERIANEGFLRTATERRSVLELARSIGYELRPGVAAATRLAFTLDDTPASPPSVRLAEGTRAQSVPGQDETAQTFETVEEIEARRAWNALRPQLAVSSPLRRDDVVVHLEGTATGLQVGDALLFVGDERKQVAASDAWDLRYVASVTTLSRPATEGPNAGTTVVTLDRGLGSSHPPGNPPQRNAEVYALRQRAGVFGHNALDWKALPTVTKLAYLGLGPEAPFPDEHKKEWPAFAPILEAAGKRHRLHLDGVHPKVIAGVGWLVLSLPNRRELFHIASAAESAQAQFGLAGKTTLVTLEAGENEQDFHGGRREVVVYAQSEKLVFAKAPRTDDVEGGEILIEPAVEGLAPGRLLAVTGRDKATGKDAGEVVEVLSAEAVGEGTRVVLAAPLQRSYERSSVRINANVARATHGATVKDEVLGSGDGSTPFQRFMPKGKPLTYVSAAVGGGAASTLRLSVKGVRWREIPSLYGAGPNDRSFVTRRADDGTVSVQMGDGVHGARPPTGANNVTATYRVGIGLEGLVDAGAITTLLSRPLGLKAVSNPVPATGAMDPETLAGARGNAPLTVLTLDRIVSLQDVEDFARAFSGIGKADATLLWNGERQVVHLTVAGTDGRAVDPASDTFLHLLAALDAARHADELVHVSPHVPVTFTVSARVATDPDRVRDDVLAGVRQALVDAFSFDARAFGQGVTSSEVLAVMQHVEGVVAVDLETLADLDPFAHPNVLARRAHRESSGVVGADLLLIDPDGILLLDFPT